MNLTLTRQAKDKLAELGLTAEQLLYEALDLPCPEPNAYFSEHLGLTVVTFQSECEQYWYSFCRAHSTMSGKGRSPEQALAQAKANMDLLLSKRSLSPLELRCAKAVSKGRDAMFALSGKDSPIAIGKALASVFPKELQDSSYLLGYLIASEEQGVDGKAADWAARELLKHTFVTRPIEEYLTKVLG